MNSSPRLKRPGPSLRLSLILIVIGAALAIPSLVLGLSPILHLVNSGTFTAPGTDSVHLGAGEYFVYEDTGSTGLGFDISSDGVTIAPADVSVTTLQKESLQVHAPGTVEHLPFNGRQYTAAVAFTTPAAGDYLVTVRTPNGETHRVLVARSFSHVIRRVVVWFGLAGLGGMVFIAGLVLLIVGAVRRGRIERAAAFVPAAYPAGWYPDPDPQGAGRWRYWDGTRWTEHLR